jgi:hypothetical protein
LAEELPDNVAKLAYLGRVRLTRKHFSTEVHVLISFIQSKLNMERDYELDTLPQPVADSPAPFAFGWSTTTSTLRIIPGPQNIALFPFSTSERDHSNWLLVCREQTDRLIADIQARRFNIRAAYSDSLERYRNDLPMLSGGGNFVLADSEARTLRHLFVADASVLPPPFSSRLRTLLEQHSALRPFYPEVERLFHAIREGRLDEPLPQDAVEAFARTVYQHTPDVFDPPISVRLQDVNHKPPSISVLASEPSDVPGTILPPPDPLGSIAPLKSRSFLTASSINALYKAFLAGKVAKSDHGLERHRTQTWLFCGANHRLA